MEEEKPYPLLQIVGLDSLPKVDMLSFNHGEGGSGINLGVGLRERNNTITSEDDTTERTTDVGKTPGWKLSWGDWIFKRVESCIPSRFNKYLARHAETQFQRVWRLNWTERKAYQKRLIKFVLLLAALIALAVYVSFGYDPVGALRQQGVDETPKPEEPPLDPPDDAVKGTDGVVGSEGITGMLSRFLADHYSGEPLPLEDSDAGNAPAENYITSPKKLLDRSDPLHDDVAKRILANTQVYPKISPSQVRFGYIEIENLAGVTGNMSIDELVNNMKALWANQGKPCACAANMGIMTNIVVVKRETGSAFEKSVDQQRGKLSVAFRGANLANEEFYIMIYPTVPVKYLTTWSLERFKDNLQPEGFGLAYPPRMNVEYLAISTGKKAKETLRGFRVACLLRCLELAS